MMRTARILAVLIAALAALEAAPATADAYLGVVPFLGKEAGRPIFNEAGHMATDAAGDLYVSDSPNLSVREFSPSGALTLSFGRPTLATSPPDGEFRTIGGIAVDQRSGDVYVTDPAANRVQTFSADGRFLAKWGRNGGDGTGGREPGEFETPTAVGVSRTGEVYVSDSAGPVTTPSRIQRFTADGRFLAEWVVGYVPVSGIAIDDFGTVYASAVGLGKYDSQGNWLGYIQPAPPSFPRGRYSYSTGAMGVGVDPRDGGIWFANPSDHRLEKHASDGRLLTLCEPRTPEMDLFESTSGAMAVASNGDVYTTARASVFDPDSAFPEVYRLQDASPPAVACDPPLHITGARLEPSRFRTAPTPRSGARGAYLSYAVYQGGTAQAIVDSGFAGRRLGTRCVRTGGHRRARRCVAYRRIGKRVFGPSQRYGDAIRFYGWLGNRRMRPGHYRLRLTAGDFRGRHSPAVIVPFTIVR